MLIEMSSKECRHSEKAAVPQRTCLGNGTLGQRPNFVRLAVNLTPDLHFLLRGCCGLQLLRSSSLGADGKLSTWPSGEVVPCNTKGHEASGFSW